MGSGQHVGPWTWMLCLVEQRGLKEKERRREGGLARTEEEMPTSEEELAKRTREGWPETQGSPGEASGAAARDTRFKGRTDGQVHRTPLRGWKGSPPLPPPAAEAENFRENSPRGHLQSLPIHLPCRTPRPVPPGSACPTESLRGTRSQGFGRGGIPVCGKNAAPTLRGCSH